MAIVDLGGVFEWPRLAWSVGVMDGGPNFMEMIGGTTKFAWIVRVPKSGTLDMAEVFMQFLFTSQPTKVSFQDVTSTGDPDGVIDQFRAGYAQGNNTWIVPGLITSDGTDTGTKRTVTRGDWLAVVFEWTGTAGDIGWGYLNTHAGTGDYRSARQADCFVKSFNGTTWSGQTGAGHLFALKYSDGTYAQFGGSVAPCLANTSSPFETFNSGSTPDEIGLYLTTVAPLRIRGLWAGLDQAAALDVVLYDTNGTTALATVSLDTRKGVSGPAKSALAFAADVDLPIGTGYRLAVKPTTTTSVSLCLIALATGAHRGAHPGGLTCQYTSRTDAGAWTQTATKLPQMGLLVSGLDAGGSGAASGSSVAYLG